jgi:hypothetical protein
MYMIAGSKDEYNADAKVESFIVEANKRGFSVSPNNPIIENGHHTLNFVADALPQILMWIGKELPSNQQ